MKWQDENDSLGETSQKYPDNMAAKITKQIKIFDHKQFLQDQAIRLVNNLYAYV